MQDEGKGGGLVLVGNVLCWFEATAQGDRAGQNATSALKV
jgi:hypothetical protein